MKTLCPRCNQGWILAFCIRENGKIVNICEECEALWPAEKTIEANNFDDMVTYLKSFGLKGLWIDLEELINH
jgi:hypothetical protein